MHDSNVIGPMIAKLRFQRNWTQELLAAKMQVKGLDITRDITGHHRQHRITPERCDGRAHYRLPPRL